ncbi:protein kinase family protein [Striga asiatica]|uniref:non-specific serine/threonine protein kinase n=1 Tax=Striga asiatica TaxID=4170 RepID=A0A5A7QXU1_STRAF|nr:protein kinase family protein [Striga asiatica]
MINEKEGESDSQWKGFLKKLKKGPGAHFHPTIPHLLSIRKLSRKRTSEGGYSEVYKGHLEDGQLIAVKRLIRGTPEEMTADYLSELGILVHVNHPNIAGIIGYGVEGGMHLREKLIWRLRYNISLGIASGLSYLHEGCQRRIIHRDIKSANILLTEDFEPQISDFGLAKWLPDQWTHLNVSQFEGTFGYLPPEFFMNGTVDEKTDVYAFGVLLLELISGRPAIDESHNSVVMWAKPLLASKSITDIIDPLLDGVYDLDQVLLMLKGDDSVSQNKKKFQKRPGLRRTYPLELIEEEECNSNKSPLHDRNHKINNITIFDQDSRCQNGGDDPFLQNTA